ncbi:MAG TPA: spore coat associated protein CotJA [Candidatus Aphodomorpha intestinavium]|uniref:Spore coat associated protein CotJA n=1 Tax=Candidatus Aphodomorpha intestinavium TaxID=2840672 RepID=A0A9D1N337_9FIRM|nr:spore coat associated protein CotJA [Candidatus Aphodomorpha intestinavium]
MVYFPVQEYRAGYCPDEALRRGTLFPELASNYVGGCC